MQIRVIFALPSLVPPPLAPWAAAPVAYPSIHHWAEVVQFISQHAQLRDVPNCSCCSTVGMNRHVHTPVASESG